MKRRYYFGLLGLLVFEIANVYFIMPMPGMSQEINSLDVAYFLYNWRWVFRMAFGLLIFSGVKSAFSSTVWLALVASLGTVALVYIINFVMAAETMFYQPRTLVFEQSERSIVDPEKLVLGIVYNGQAKAYPIQFLGYHHQVRDIIGGKPVMVTYCTVCRTGRVFEPLINGKTELFRLVGMDHFNAMFEDQKTKSWWRQATGEAVAGPLKGAQLPEFPHLQTTLEKWNSLYPNTLIMQPDSVFQVEYDSMQTYERGRLWGKLTRRDTASWQQKSWIIGVQDGLEQKTFDWNQLQRKGLIHDYVGKKPILVALAQDGFSFIVFERASAEQYFTIKNDTLRCEGKLYNFLGQSLGRSAPDLQRLQSYQEYWHSWQTFHLMSEK